jgi:hemerythrin-like metal-binding protein
MAIFEWNEKLSTGFDEIDAQHKKLLGLVNELHDAMRNRRGKEVLGYVLEELRKYTVYHFSNEERAFDRYGYPEAAEHKRWHAEIVRKLEDLTVRHEQGEITLSVATLEFVVEWVTTHIMKADKAYVPFMRDKPIMF